MARRPVGDGSAAMICAAARAAQGPCVSLTALEV
jgi:hypothetical protein